MFKQWKSRTIFVTEYSLTCYWRFQSIKIPTGTNNWDIGTYRNKLKNVYYKVAESVRLDQMNYYFHHKIRNLQNICKTDIYFWRQNLENNFDFLFNFKKNEQKKLSMLCGHYLKMEKKSKLSSRKSRKIIVLHTTSFFHTLRFNLIN